jgi:FkbM family methyltransferase
MKEEFRRLLNRFGYDFHRIGAKQVGRNCCADIRAICGPPPVEVIFDVGANVGQAAHLFSTQFPEAAIYSFEPFPEAFKLLQANVSSLKNVKTFPFGFGETAGRKTFFLNQGSELNSLLPNAQEGEAYIDRNYFHAIGECQVEIATLDQFCEDTSANPTIDLLKIDTQGSELAVLRGAMGTLSSGRIKCVLLEVNFVPLYAGQPAFAELNEVLTQAGFRFVSFYDHAFHPDHFLKWADALFVRVRQGRS